MDIEKGISKNTFKWIESLAMEEINMEETGIVHYDNHIDPSIALEQSSIDLMEEIRDFFEIYITKFNEYRSFSESKKSLIKIFKISNTINDFMLFRNSLKLVVSRSSEDTISLGFVSNSSGFYPARTIQRPQQLESSVHEIRARVGAFNEIRWNFQGDDINVESLVRYYLTEFIRQSSS